MFILQLYASLRVWDGRESAFNSIVLVRSPKRLICALSGETQRQPRPFWAKALSDAETERPRPLADCSGVSMTDVDAARFGSARSDMGGQQAATRLPGTTVCART